MKSKDKIALIICVIIIYESIILKISLACNVGFPNSLFGDRIATFSEIPEGLFVYEASYLVKRPSDPFILKESEEDKTYPVIPNCMKEERELYEKAAQAFNEEMWDDAKENLEKLLKLPKEKRANYSVVANYMLGRLYRNTGEFEKAKKAFSQVRDLVKEGFIDPIGLAISSYGEEARLFIPDYFGIIIIPEHPIDYLSAIRLYAIQASYGSQIGRLSLTFVARHLLNDEDEEQLNNVLKDPLGQKLITTYLWTRGSTKYIWERYEKVINKLLSIENLSGADRLSAVAYSAGKYEIAEKFSNMQETPISLWVKAKLALRNGELQQSESLLEKAEKLLSKEKHYVIKYSVEGVDFEITDAKKHILGERAILNLLKDNPLKSMELAYESGFWIDIAYIAEKILDIQQLESFVISLKEKQNSSIEENNEEYHFNFSPSDKPKALRNLLARRLMRMEEYERGYNYFTDDNIRKIAQEYGNYLRKSEKTTDPIEKAKLLYNASVIARRYGLEIMGTELDPDWGLGDGEYELYDYLKHVTFKESNQTEKNNLISQSEIKALQKNAPKHYIRFHYRSVAADLAESAASLLPKRSFAYAAVLCKASSYIRSKDPDRFRRIYETYVKNGALILNPPNFSKLFGYSCPEPDFESVKKFKYKEFQWPRKRVIAKWSLIIGGPLFGILLFTIFLNRHRRRRSL